MPCLEVKSVAKDSKNFPSKQPDLIEMTNFQHRSPTFDAIIDATSPEHPENQLLIRKLDSSPKKRPLNRATLVDKEDEATPFCGCCQIMIITAFICILCLTLTIIALVLEFSESGVPYKARKPTKTKPCEKKLCGYGAVCRVDPATNKAYCKCVEECDGRMVAPVCGSDNVTYSNECLLKMASCKAQSALRVNFHGSCNMRDPCLDLKCEFNARCVVSVDGRSAQCVCPDRCQLYGDSNGSRPVCGNDGVDYPTLCHLHMESCKNSRNISVKYQGRCDPCANVSCVSGTKCKLDMRREPRCRCSEQCPLTQDYVCASDGKTYQNPCVMSVHACKSNKDLRVVFKGACETGKDPCASLQCDYGKECFVDINNQSRCACLHRCEPVMRPVCGKDGLTYDNECELKREACINETRNYVDHKGTCGIGKCANHQCQMRAICVLRNERPVCECPRCSADLSPVCASNGISFPNECKMRYESCKTGRNIYVKYQGYCLGCQNKKCDYYSHCVSDGKGNGECVCPTEEDCPSTDSFVCATDGRTYSNECLLRVNACRKKMFIVRASYGACDSCQGVTCPWGSRCEDVSPGIPMRRQCVCPKACQRPRPEDVVCGSDGKIYKSQCYMMRAACSRGMTLKMEVLSRCPVGGPVEEADEETCSSENCLFAGLCMDDNMDGIKECICDFSCQDRPTKPVCGSDGVIYKNSCVMDMTSCNLQKAIYEETTFGVCDGFCQCNRVGSYSDNCDPLGYCPCRPGVGGKKCDHCLPGFWGMRLIPLGSVGCKPCGCSVFGSARDDCEQSTGRCVCKDGVGGMKCDSCAPAQILIPQGCVHIKDYKEPSSCRDLICYHGAKCRIQAGKPVCVCPKDCDLAMPAGYTDGEVCGTDGVSYGSLCQLKIIACRHQRDIVASSLGPCPNTSPKSRSTTENMRVTKYSGPDRYTASNEGSQNNIPTTMVPTKPTKGSLGKRCWDDGDCRVKNSVCAEHLGKSVCLCKSGFLPVENNRLCVEFVANKTNSLTSPCLDHKCRNNGECVSDIREIRFGYRCECPKSYAGRFCEMKKTPKQLYSLPLFGGHSYLEFEKMEAYSHVTIEIEFKPEEVNGILLYNGRKDTDRKGDFIALTFINQRIELR